MSKNIFNQEKLFDSENGFGKFKSVAIALLEIVVTILSEFGIEYCLISGTLLGYVRHNDFIPWDDDMDLLVDDTFIDKLPKIFEKYGIKLTFLKKNNWHIRICFNNADNKLEDNQCVTHWKNFLMNDNSIYSWPFIDLFSYYKSSETTISFFYKTWDITKFLPTISTSFLNLNVKIPSEPSYFLEINYGTTYMSIAKSSNWCHKKEIPIRNISEKIIKISF